MGIIDLIIVIAFVINFILSTVIFIHRKESSGAGFFSLAAYSTALWILAMFLFRNTDINLLIVPAKLLYIAGISIATWFLYFSFSFLSEGPSMTKKRLPVLGIIPVLLLFLLIFSESVIKDVLFINSERTVVFGPLYTSYSVLLFFYFSWAYLNLLKKFKVSPKRTTERIQLLFVLIGTIVSVIFGLVFDIFVPYFGNFKLYWLGPVMTLVFVSSTSYAIFKHHLFNVKVIATELLTFVIWIFLLIQIFLAETLQEQVASVILLGLVIFFGILLIRSVLKEVRQRQYIEKLMKQRSEFLDVASHQLRTPVSVILGTISLFREGDSDKLSQDQRRHFIDNIFHKAQKLANIVNDLLEASEMDTAEPFQLTREYLKPTDPRDIVQEVIKELRPKAEEKGLRIEFNSPEDIPLVRTDPERLEQALTNLVDNAVKYTQKGFVRVELSQKDGRVIIAVSDSGIGIPEADQPRIFEKFARAKNAAELYTDGSGLGLFIVKAIIEAHEGGKIWFESEENKGTTFYVSLPAYQEK